MEYTDDILIPLNSVIKKHQNILKGTKRMERKQRYILIFTCFIITATIMSVLFGAIFGIAFISGESMKPTISGGDIAFFYRLARPVRGDIVLLDIGKDGYIKRIAGIPGDTIEFDGNGRVTLGENEYFVLGDNLDNSYDSRNFGPIKIDKINGTLMSIIHTDY